MCCVFTHCPQLVHAISASTCTYPPDKVASRSARAPLQQDYSLVPLRSMSYRFDIIAVLAFAMKSGLLIIYFDDDS